MIVRFALFEDLPQILDLYKELNPEDKPIDLESAQKIWENSQKQNIIKYVVAEDNNKIIATCNIAIILNLTRSGRPYGVIENVITMNINRRQGIGKSIIGKAIDYAKENNCYKVVLLSSNKRKEAHSFYESIGFNGSSKKGFEIRI
jgi:N-acetylglutamate synthase-like GNAT family acetyltransferase